MAIKASAPFDPKAILAKVGEGQSIGKYRKNQPVFAQGEPADAAFFIQKGKAPAPAGCPQARHIRRSGAAAPPRFSPR